MYYNKCRPKTVKLQQQQHDTIALLFKFISCKLYYISYIY